MSRPLPYICSRCLQASRRAVRLYTLSNASRPFYSQTTARISSVQDAIIGRKGTTAHTFEAKRYLSTSSRRLKPSLESHTTAKTEPPPSTSPISVQQQQQYTTTTVLNPRTDEETGEPMTISITPRATKRLSQIMAKDSNPHLCLRVTVESGGCHGFQYLMSLVDVSKVDESEDVLFVGSSPDAPIPETTSDGGWRQIAEGRPKVVIDESSLELLNGSKVDYTMELIGSQFKIDNPRASSSCGCGTSFDVKI